MFVHHDLVAQAAGGPGSDLWVMDLERRSLHPVPAADNAYFFDWTHDAR